MLALMCCGEDLAKVLRAFHSFIGKEVINPEDFLLGDRNYYLFLKDDRPEVGKFITFAQKGYKKCFEEVDVTGTVLGFQSEDFLEKAVCKFNETDSNHYIDNYSVEQVYTTSGPVYLPLFEDEGLFGVFSRFMRERLSFEEDGLVEGEEVIFKS